MDCRTAGRLISLQPDEQLTIEESDGLARHLAGCRTCAGEQFLQKRLTGTLQDMGRLEMTAPVDLSSLVMKELRTQRRSVLSYIPVAWRKAVAAAAALLLIAGGSGGAAGLWKMAGGDKNLALEPNPTVNVDSGYTGPGPAGEITVPGSKDSGAIDPSGIDTSQTGQKVLDQTTGGTGGGGSSLPIASTLAATNMSTEGTALLSGGMKVTSTVLKFTVGDITAARAKAVSIAAGAGATNQVFPEQSGGKTVLVMRMTIDSEQAAGLISNLSQVGTLLDRQDESRDLTALYNETLVQYNDLLARQGQDSAEQQKLEVQAASYKQQLDSWSQEAGKRIVMVWLEGQ